MPWCPDNGNTIIFFNPINIFTQRTNVFETQIEIHNPNEIVSCLIEFEYDTLLFNIDSIKIENIANHIFQENGVNNVVSDLHFSDSTNVVKIGVLGRQDDFIGTSNDGSIAKIYFAVKNDFWISQLTFTYYEIYNWPITDSLKPDSNITTLSATVFR